MDAYLKNCFKRDSINIYFPSFRTVVCAFLIVGSLLVSSVLITGFFSVSYGSVVPLTIEEKAWLIAHPDIQLGAPTSYPPLVIKNTHGPHTGMLVDLFELISQRLHTNIQLHIEDSWPSVLKKAEHRTIDGLASGGRSANRAKYLNSTDALYSTYYYVFSRSSDQQHVKSVNDLEGMRIGYKKADTPVRSLLDKYAGVMPVSYIDNAAMTKGLMNKEVDVLVAWISYDFYRRDKLQGAVDNILLATDTPLDMYVHIRKDWPELIPILNKVLASIRQNELPAIMDKWFIKRPLFLGTHESHLTPKEQAWLEKKQSARVRVIDYPPYIIPHSAGDPEGIVIDYLKLISQRTGVQFEYVSSDEPFNQALDGLKNHQGPDLISTIVSTPERKKTILFSRDYITSPYVIFMRTDNKQIISSMDDLLGKKVALQKGSALQKLVSNDYPGINLMLFDFDIQAIEAVASGEADAYIGNMVMTSYLILNRGPYNLKITAPSSFGDQHFSMGIRNDWPELAGIINKGLATITPKEQNEIRNRYISVRYENKENTLILKWFLLVIASATGMILLFFLWTRSLKKQVATQTSELKYSEENYRELFENMVQGAFYQSNDGRLLDVNSAALEIFGLTYDQFVGKTSKDPQWNVVREDGSDFPGEEHPSMVALKTGKPCRDVVAGIYNVINSYNWVTINAIPQFKENESRPYQVFVTMHDITARKQSEDLLRIQHDLSYQLSDVDSFERGFEICLDSSLNASHMEAGGIYLLNKESGGVDLVCHKGLPVEFVKSVQHFGPDSEHVVILKKKTALYTEYKNLPIPQTEAEKSADFRAVCIIPILFQDLAIGCINLTSSSHREVPGFARVAIETIASQIGGWVNYIRTKQTLHDSENRFSLAMEAAQDGIYDWDLINNSIYYSPGWKRMLGYKDAELPNDFSVWEKLTTPQGVQQAWQMQNELISKKRDRFELEFQMQHKDGHWVDILSRATVIFDATGTAVRIVGTHVDITEQKHATQRLHDVLQFNEKIISTSPVGLSIYEGDSGCCIAANDCIVKLIGGTKEEVLRQNFYELESWKKSGLLTTAKEVLASHISKQKTIEVTSSFGKPIAIDCYFTQFSFGEKQHLSVTTTDVTQKLMDEKTIIHQREAAERYLNLAGVMFIGLDKIGNINVANKKACQILEVRQEDVLGQNWFDNFIPQDTRGEVYSVFQQIIDGDIEPFEYYENAVVSKNGKEKQIAWHNTVLKNENGNILGLLGSGEDITEKKQLRSKLQQAQKMESIGTLAGGIAHDFNNILSSILGFSELALDGVEKGSEVEDDLQEVLIAGTRAKELVKQILTFARQSEETVKPIQVDIIAKEILKFLKSSIPATIEIKEEINSDSFIMGSPTQVHQILMNLCTNASQAMEASGGILEVSLEDVIIQEPAQISGVNPGEYIKIDIKDTGAGISPRDISSVFEPYFTTKKVGEGTGMGLAVVHGIVESYGGKITVNSSINNGSTFSVYLPITKKRGKKTFSEKVELPSGNEHILLVDDEVAIAKMGSRILEQLGYDVTIKTSSVEALELFRSYPKKFDLLVTDMTMPNMTGDKLAVELMEIRPDIPVILCTGYSKTLSEENATELGIKAFVYKPIAKVDFAKTVRNVLDEAKKVSLT